MFEDETNDNDLQAELYRDLMLERNNIADLLEEDHKSEKRLPSGFIGSRGKKSVNNDDYYEFEKRAPMGFQGVRGKKSEFPNYIQTEDKRAPLAGFFGMRGKKQPIVSLNHQRLNQLYFISLIFLGVPSVELLRSSQEAIHDIWEVCRRSRQKSKTIKNLQF